MSVPALRFEAVTARYGNNGPAVASNVSFSVEQGERVALLGLNGSGKTTLLLCAAGLLHFQGRIMINGVAVAGSTIDEARRHMGFLFNVPEDQILFPRVIDDVAFALQRTGVAPADALRRSQAMLAALGVGPLAAHSPFQLSHGQRQRVALAGALVGGPALLLLDEPTSALDPPGRLALARLLQEQRAAMLVATHDIEFAARVCTRCLLAAQGAVTETQFDQARVQLFRDGGC